MSFTCRTCHAVVNGHRAEHCTVCHQTFTGATAGDMHRVGKHGVKTGPDRRRCLTAAEMVERGLILDEDRSMWRLPGTWRGPADATETDGVENLSASQS